MLNYKCILVYGLNDEEIEKIKKRRIRYKIVTENEANMKISSILSGSDKDNYKDKLPKDEKALIFNGYNDKELRNEIKFIRSFVKGGVLAIVTQQSANWTFKYLIEHLIEERTFYEKQNRGESK